jgi:hypothetical protein
MAHVCMHVWQGQRTATSGCGCAAPLITAAARGSLAGYECERYHACAVHNGQPVLLGGSQALHITACTSKWGSSRSRRRHLWHCHTTHPSPSPPTTTTEEQAMRRRRSRRRRRQMRWRQRRRQERRRRRQQQWERRHKAHLVSSAGARSSVQCIKPPSTSTPPQVECHAIHQCTNMHQDAVIRDDARVRCSAAAEPTTALAKVQTTFTQALGA